jgi:putative salt-induced outer membrane protein
MLKIGRMISVTVAVWMIVVAAPASAGQGAWSGSLGLSVTSTTGNTSTSNLGLDFKLKMAPRPWGMEAAFSWVRAEKDGMTSANQVVGSVRGTRELDESMSLFVGLAGERDTFAGLDQRLRLEAGAAYKILLGPRYELAVEGGVTRTREERTDGSSTNDWGGLVGGTYGLHFSESGVVTERLVFYPNVTHSANWRLTSDLGAQAKLSELLALRIAYQVRYSNKPPTGFGKTDTSTLASLVVSF